MICPKCGNNVNEGEAFCKKCGMKLEAADNTSEYVSIPVQQTVQAPVYQQPKQDAPRGRVHLSSLEIILIIVVVISVGANIMQAAQFSSYQAKIVNYESQIADQQQQIDNYNNESGTDKAIDAGKTLIDELLGQ